MSKDINDRIAEALAAKPKEWPYRAQKGPGIWYGSQPLKLDEKSQWVSPELSCDPRALLRLIDKMRDRDYHLVIAHETVAFIEHGVGGSESEDAVRWPGHRNTEVLMTAIRDAAAKALGVDKEED